MKNFIIAFLISFAIFTVAFELFGKKNISQNNSAEIKPATLEVYQPALCSTCSDTTFVTKAITVIEGHITFNTLDGKTISGLSQNVIITIKP